MKKIALTVALVAAAGSTYLQAELTCGRMPSACYQEKVTCAGNVSVGDASTRGDVRPTNQAGKCGYIVGSQNPCGGALAQKIDPCNE
jgi:hypothetical protein